MRGPPLVGWCSDNAKDQSSEITAIPPLLRLLELAGCIVTVNSIGWQAKIVETMAQPQADDLIAVSATSLVK